MLLLQTLGTSTKAKKINKGDLIDIKITWVHSFSMLTKS